MTTPTKIALSAFAVLIVGGILVTAASPRKMPMVDTAPTIVPMPYITASSTAGASGTPSSLPVLSDHMPEFTGIARWWNTADGQPLTPAKLKGKVVLVDFWTYSCINCIRTYPFLKSMYDKYADKGLVIVGVHTPEFAFEADPNNVGREITKNGLKYPIALDANYGTWNAYQNEYWPAEYFFDRQGHLRHTHFGEGEYDQSEEVIRSLLDEQPGVTLGPMGEAVPTPDFSKIETSETYFGLGRGNAFQGTPGANGKDTTYPASVQPAADKWSAMGTWRFTPEYVQAVSPAAVFRFNVQANALHLVLDSADGTDKTIEIFVDGKATTKMTVNASTLYTVATFPDAARHTVEIRLPDPGVRFYSATFS